MKHFKNKILYIILLMAASCNGKPGDTNTMDSSKAATNDTLSLSKPELPASDVTVTVPEGFSTTIFAGGLGKGRHIAVTPSGYVYVKLASKKNGKTIVQLKDTNGDGVADQEAEFGDFEGTGIAVKNGYLYASSDEEVYRYKLNDDGTVINPKNPEKIVTGLIARNEHEPKAIRLDNDGNLYVNIGAYSNSCQIDDRQTGSLGMKPCPVLDSAAGIWQFKADKPNQSYGDGVRYATGLRNVVGLDWNTVTNSLFVMQHGRDQLGSIFPKLYTTKQNA